MPVFEYKCTKCGGVTEFLERAGADTKHVCEKCGSTKMQKLLSAFSVGDGRGSSSSTGSSCPTCSTGVCDL